MESTNILLEKKEKVQFFNSNAPCKSNYQLTSAKLKSFVLLSFYLQFSKLLDVPFRQLNVSPFSNLHDYNTIFSQMIASIIIHF